MPKQGRATRARSWKRLLMVAVVCALVFLVIVLTVEMLGASALNRAVREAKEIGGPLSGGELFRARKKWEGDRNAADVILGIRSKIDKARVQPGWAANVPLFDPTQQPIELGRRWSPDVQQRVRGFLAQYAVELAAIDTLKDFEGGQFPLRLSEEPMEIQLPPLAALHTSFLLKCVEVIARGMDGDTVTLDGDMDTLMTHSRLLAQEPSMVSSVVARVCEETALRAVESIMSVTQVPAETLKRVQDLLVDRDMEAEMKWNIRCERAVFVAGADQLRKNGSAGPTGPLLLQLARFSRVPGARGWMLKSEADGIKLFNRMLNADGALGAYQEAVASETRVKTGGPLGAFTALMFPILSGELAEQIEWCAELRSAKLAIAAEQYRMGAGHWPSRLDELVPEYIEVVPEDPFAPGQRLRMARVRDRLVIYSIGRDMSDDKGKLLRGVRNDDSPDIGFILLDPEARNQGPVPESQGCDTSHQSS